MQQGGRLGQPSGTSTGRADSLRHRTGLEDSITIYFRFLDSTRLQRFDSSVKDFTKHFPIPWHHFHLGNLGTASQSFIFSPLLQPGWDHGFHAFDVYNSNIANSRFYTTTRPYSELGYMLGSQAEQIIHLLHTQNIRPNWNASIQYRLINSPGTFQNQGTNHNNYHFSSWYQSVNKRYQNFVIILANKLQSSENGGIKNDGNYLDSVPFEERSTIPTQLGLNRPGSRNFFSSNISTGSKFNNSTYLLRQQYDIGQKDSIVTDTTIIPLFYPRLRLEHTVSYNIYKYRFSDDVPDSSYYARNYNDTSNPSRIYKQDLWRVLKNEFSVYQFPDAKNSQQFIKAGAGLQNLSGNFDTGLIKKSYYNFYIHGEYRNRTRNQKWDIEAFGNIYLNGLNAGDYNAYISLKRLISKQLGYLQVGFQNVNRSPSFTFASESSFHLDGPSSFNKENITTIFGSLEQPQRRLKLSGAYYLLTNYTYYKNYFQPAQASSLFNVLQVIAEKQIRIKKNWNWRTRIVVQQRAGDAPVNLPLVLTRNQVGYDGSLGFKNLLISMGLEVRYFTSFKGNGYSPLLGQFFTQDTTTIRLKTPEVGAYVHFRIKSFTAYFRVENLNTFDGSGFSNNNVVFPDYPYPGMQIRLGIFWSFVN